MNNSAHFLHGGSLSGGGEAAVLPNVQKPTHRVKKKEETGKIFQTKEQGKTPITDLNETEISDTLDRKIKIIVIKMVTDVTRTMHEQRKNFKRDIENIRKYPIGITKQKNRMTEVKTRYSPSTGDWLK